MKFSIIVPVYNVEKYIDKCLNSVKNQTYKNFEVLVVNDGSPDDSDVIIKKYLKMDKRFKYFEKVNGGLSDARNYGVKHAKGEYLIFVDSDDYIDVELLEKLNNVLNEEKYDIIRYSATTVFDDGTIVAKHHINDFSGSSTDAIKIITSNYLVEPTWLYAYNRKFYNKNKISFPKGMIHEDFGTTLLALSYAKSIRIIDYNGYYYVQRSNSIMSNSDYSKELVKTKDFFLHHLNNRKILSRNDNIGNKLLLNYSASCTICKGRGLKSQDLNKYVNAIKKYKVIDDIYGNSFKRKVKKLYLKLNLKHYIISLRGK